MKPSAKSERGLPTNMDAESGLIGSILLKPDVLDDVSPIVAPDDFILGAHGTVYSHAMAIYSAGRIPDQRLLLASLKKAGELDDEGNIGQVGGAMAFIESLFQREPTAFNAVYYAKMVKETAMLRGLISICQRTANEAHEQDADGEVLLSRLESEVAAIAEKGREQTEAHAGDVLAQALERIPQPGQPAPPIGIPTGFIDLDQKLGGMAPGDFIILAGRPSMGKSALAGNIAERVSVDMSETVLFFSLEMGSLQIANRLLFARARINHRKGALGFLTTDERRKLVETQSEYAQSGLMLDESASPTVSQIASTSRRVKRKRGLGLIVIDYLQLISPDNPRDPRQEQVAKIARSLKIMAKTLHVPVLCLAQLNRQAESTSDHRPRLSHLRESGAIEQDADVVMFVHREEYYATDQEEKDRLKGRAEIIIAKQRNGPTGEVPMAWFEDFMRFETIAKGGEEFDADKFDYPGGTYGF